MKTEHGKPLRNFDLKATCCEDHYRSSVQVWRWLGLLLVKNDDFNHAQDNTDVFEVWYDDIKISVGGFVA